MQKDYDQGVDKTAAWKGTQFNLSKSESQGPLTQFDEFIVIGTRQGQPVIVSNVSEQQARQLLKTHASNLMPLTA